VTLSFSKDGRTIIKVGRLKVQMGRFLDKAGNGKAKILGRVWTSETPEHKAFFQTKYDYFSYADAFFL